MVADLLIAEAERLLLDLGVDEIMLHAPVTIRIWRAPWRWPDTAADLPSSSI